MQQLFLSLAFCGLLLSPSLVFADPEAGEAGDSNAAESSGPVGPTSSDSLKHADLNNITQQGAPTTFESLAGRIMKIMGVFIIFVAILGIMIGGMMLIFSAGDESMMERGKGLMIASIIGLVVTLMAYVIITLIRSFLYTPM